MKLVVTTIAALGFSMNAVADINEVPTEDHPIQFIAKQNAEQAKQQDEVEPHPLKPFVPNADTSIEAHHSAAPTKKTPSIAKPAVEEELEATKDELKVQIQEVQNKTDGDIESKINEVEKLVSQINSKDDQLNNLIEELTAKKLEEKKKAEAAAKAKAKKAAELKAQKAKQAKKKVTASKTKYSNRAISRNAAPARVARMASRRAHAKSVGLCAKYVRIALQAGGYKFTPNPSAYMYETRGTLRKIGFAKIPNNTPVQVGDIVVVSRSKAHPHGHMSIYDGRNWISDFRQKRKSPYRKYYRYTTWRDARYLNGAKPIGTYMAKK